MTHVHVVTAHNRSHYENQLLSNIIACGTMSSSANGDGKICDDLTASRAMPTTIPTPSIFSRSTADASSAGRGSIRHCFHT